VYNAATTRLVRGLGPWAAASLVVGTIIGTGVFLKTAVMAQLGGSALWVLVAWARGALSFFGALTYAELGGMVPAAGGEYVHLRRAGGASDGLFGLERVRRDGARGAVGVRRLEQPAEAVGEVRS